MKFLVAVLAILIGIVLWAVSIFNDLVARRNRFTNAFAQIDVQLKRRYDLIPNLVATAKAYLKHESETLEAVIAARGNAVTACNRAARDPANPAAMRGLQQAEGLLNGAMSRLFALQESYPELKADRQTALVTEELVSTENRIAFARQAFNDEVMLYNTALEQFPGNVIAGMSGFQRAAHLESTQNETERGAVKVAF